MKKSRIYLSLGIATAIVGALVMFVLQVDVRSAAIIGVGMLVTLVVPVLIINIMLNKIDKVELDSKKDLQEAETKLADMVEKFSAVTLLDELTGCSNKRHFIDMLYQQKAMSERGTYEFTVIVTQVDSFDDIVQTEGPGRGDEVLQLYSRIVKAALREVDILARLERDQFAMVLSGCTEDDALLILGRISQLIEQIQVSEQTKLKVTQSCGLTSFHGTETPEDLIEHASQALIFASRQGGDM